jgi:hypothetical protein
VKRVGQVREDITLFIKTQTYKKKESLRKVQPSSFFTLRLNVKAEMIFEKSNSKNEVLALCKNFGKSIRAVLIHQPVLKIPEQKLCNVSRS